MISRTCQGSIKMVPFITGVSFLICFVVPGIESVAKIAKGPQNQQYVEGDSLAYMFCIFGDLSENAIVFWEKGGEKITGSSKYTIDEFEKSKAQYGLEIRQVERIDEQEYRCGVTDNGNTIRSDVATLEVLEIPSDQYIAIDTEEYYKAGVLSTISCVCEITEPRPTLELFRSGSSYPLETIETNDKKKIMRISYSFTPTENDNSANFYCKITSPEINKMFVRFKNASINVQFRPIISIKHEKVFEAGKTAILLCETTDSNPEATDYTWTIKNGIEFNDNFIPNGKIMSIKNPTQKLNETVLGCSARNSIGKSETDVTIYVSGLDMTSSEKPLTNSETVQSNREQKSMDILLKTVIIAGIITITVIALLVLPLCLHHVCMNRHALDSLGRKISQPQIYFEAHDRVLPMPPENTDNYTWKRSLAVQVPDDLEIDIELVYQEISEKSRSRNTLMKTTSTYS